MQSFELVVHLPELLQQHIRTVQFAELQQHGFDLLLAADQHTAFGCARFVGQG